MSEFKMKVQQKDRGISVLDALKAVEKDIDKVDEIIIITATKGDVCLLNIHGSYTNELQALGLIEYAKTSITDDIFDR